MSKVVRRKDLLATPPIPMSAIPGGSGKLEGEPSAQPPLMTADGKRVHVVHIVAELAPFARSGGLGEAVNSLARFQAASGIPTSIIMPLYNAARANAPEIEPVGPSFYVQVGPRSELVRLWRLIAPPDHPLAATNVYFIESDEYFGRPHIYGPPGADYMDNGRRYACFTAAALDVLPTIAGGDPVLLHAHDWHTALAPVYLHTALAGEDGARRTPHLAQGLAGAQVVAVARLPGDFDPRIERLKHRVEPGLTAQHGLVPTHDTGAGRDIFGDQGSGQIARADVFVQRGADLAGNGREGVGIGVHGRFRSGSDGCRIMAGPVRSWRLAAGRRWRRRSGGRRWKACPGRPWPRAGAGGFDPRAVRCRRCRRRRA